MASVFRKRLKAMLLRPELFYRAYLKMKYGAGSRPGKLAKLPWNGVLKNSAEWEAAAQAGDRARLPHHRDRCKDWDHLAAVSAILQMTTPSARILDAGAELYSNVLPSLFLYGYRNLWGLNLGFKFPMRRGPINYWAGDITRTEFDDGFFDAAACLSVIEHGVPLEAYFREMYRVLKRGGLLITSTDYYPSPIDTRGMKAHEAEIKIFTKPEVEQMLTVAKRVGFERTGIIDLDCTDKPIHWETYGLEYTFVMFTLKKP
jgi:SAM-dependent methyltransferase